MANYVGKPVPRKEDHRLLMGRGCYTADLSFPGMVEAAVLRSSFAHALITRLDVTAARESQGVIAVYTAADLEGIVKPFTRPFYATVAPVLEERTGLVIRPYFAPVLAADSVLRVGEPIAVVVAENRYLAENLRFAADAGYVGSSDM